jgi:hypothetical protein
MITDLCPSFKQPKILKQGQIAKKKKKITLINARNGQITGQLCSITATSFGSSTEL